MPNTKSDDKKVIDLCAEVMTTVYLVVRQIVIPLCIIKSNAKPGIKLLTTAFCWHDVSAAASAIEKARRGMYKIHSVE